MWRRGLGPPGPSPGTCMQRWGVLAPLGIMGARFRVSLKPSCRSSPVYEAEGFKGGGLHWAPHYAERRERPLDGENSSVVPQGIQTRRRLCACMHIVLKCA